MSKPIEPGCLALVIATARTPHLVGCVVEVIEWVPAGSFYTSRKGFQRWRTEDFGAWHVEAPSEEDSGTLHPSHLLRIDGDEHVSTEEREDVEVPA